MKELIALSVPFPAELVKPPAPGKHGSYVSHEDVTQRALSIVGPFSFEVTELIRGRAVEETNRNGDVIGEARDGAVVGVLGTLTIEVDGRPVTITEAGVAEHPASENDGDNAKKAASDALKRCWMRAGLGLHLWSDNYFLHGQLLKDHPEHDDE